MFVQSARVCVLVHANARSPLCTCVRWEEDLVAGGGRWREVAAVLSRDQLYAMYQTNMCRHALRNTYTSVTFEHKHAETFAQLHHNMRTQAGRSTLTAQSQHSQSTQLLSSDMHAKERKSKAIDINEQNETQTLQNRNREQNET